MAHKISFQTLLKCIFNITIIIYYNQEFACNFNIFLTHIHDQIVWKYFEQLLEAATGGILIIEVLCKSVFQIEMMKVFVQNPWSIPVKEIIFDNL